MDGKALGRARPLAWLLAMGAMSVATGGCGDPSLASPTPVPVQPTRALTVFGTVRDEAGAPIPGARVTPTGRSPVMADQSGRYEIATDTNGLLHVVAAADGFEFNEQLARPGLTAFDLTLRKVVRLSAGEAITLELGPTDSLYGFDREYRTRVIRLTAQVYGSVEVRATTGSTGSLLGLSLGTSSPLPGFPCCPGILNASISESGELEIRVLVPWTVTHAESFTLSSRFSPR